jgi:hypothetical protein
MIEFQPGFASSPIITPGAVGDDGGVDDVYFRTISVQRWKTRSEICRRQPTADKNEISFMLIS